MVYWTCRNCNIVANKGYIVTTYLSSIAAVPSQRDFPSEVLEIGAPNLLVTAPGMCVGE